MGRITTEFVSKGLRYDPGIGLEELFKAGRTVWFMIAFQMQLNMPLVLTDCMFGYNMLYPYTDDLVDSNETSKQAKKDFAKIFHERLLHGESNYDPQAHFDGTQSDVNQLNLPDSLKPHASRVVKIFDMVKFIENDWQRGGAYNGVFMGLATIHESQMKSTLQHAKVDEGYAPTMTLLEQISAEKGGASLVAAGFLIEGRLTRTRMAYLEYLGFGLQLLDDLQVGTNVSSILIFLSFLGCPRRYEEQSSNNIHSKYCRRANSRCSHSSFSSILLLSTCLREIR